MLWCPFNALLNSSTRCELAAAILAMTLGVPMRIGIDNLSVVRNGNAIIDDLREKHEARLWGSQGQMILGGKRSKLQSKSPYKKNGR